MPQIKLDTYGCPAFAIIGLAVWLSLSNDLFDLELSIAGFGVHKRHCVMLYTLILTFSNCFNRGEGVGDG